MKRKRFNRKNFKPKNHYRPHDPCYSYDLKMGKQTTVFDKNNNEISTGDFVLLDGRLCLVIGFGSRDSRNKKYIALFEYGDYNCLRGGNKYDLLNYCCYSLLRKDNGRKMDLEIIEKYN